MTSLDSERPDEQETSFRDPSQVADRDDPGDETQRNFRYQHSYGAILLIAGAVGIEPYAAVWCEHHEDLLAERLDGSYDAFQVKTRRPEHGEWTLAHTPLKHSIRRFVELVQCFGDKIHRLIFVSNTDFATHALDIKNQRQLQRSPHRFLEAVNSAPNVAEIAEPFKEMLEELTSFCSCDERTLFEVLRRVELRKGPARDSFDTELAHNHLPQLEECKRMVPAALNAARDELVQKIFAASSLQVEDPLRHLHPVGSEPSPEVLAKRVSIQVVVECIQQSGSVPFRFQSGIANLDLGNRTGPPRILRTKLIRGGLGDQVTTMERRTHSSEARLMELALLLPQQIDDILNQIVSMVHGECDEAALEARLAGNPYGSQMLADIHKRLRNLAENRPEMVYSETYECLIGVVGLLTEDCTVWWSEQFDPEGVA